MDTLNKIIILEIIINNVKNNTKLYSSIKVNLLKEIDKNKSLIQYESNHLGELLSDHLIKNYQAILNAFKKDIAVQ